MCTIDKQRESNIFKFLELMCKCKSVRLLTEISTGGHTSREIFRPFTHTFYPKNVFFLIQKHTNTAVIKQHFVRMTVLQAFKYLWAWDDKDLLEIFLTFTTLSTHKSMTEEGKCITQYAQSVMI